VVGLELPKRVFPCASPADVRSTLPEGKDVLAFQVRPVPVHVPWVTLQHTGPSQEAHAASHGRYEHHMFVEPRMVLRQLHVSQSHSTCQTTQKA